MSDSRPVVIKSKCIETFDKALLRVEALMVREVIEDYNEIHSAKSILYAAIERVGLKAERTFYVQRMLRELMAILNESASARKPEKEVVLKMLSDLKGRYREDIFLS